MRAVSEIEHAELTGARRASVVVLAIVAALLSAGVARAQSGGTTPPGSVAPTPTPGGPAEVFPIQGPHTFGDGLGAARGSRSHQGVDIFANCGTPEVAVARGRVAATGSQSAAGNYLVIRSKKRRRDYVYMHMQAPATVAKKQKVVPGQSVGAVGDTGNASGCHLHFEIWKGKWYRGGVPKDPMPSLSYWDSYS